MYTLSCILCYMYIRCIGQCWSFAPNLSALILPAYYFQIGPLMIENDPNTSAHITDCPHLFFKYFFLVAETFLLCGQNISLDWFHHIMMIENDPNTSVHITHCLHLFSIVYCMYVPCRETYWWWNCFSLVSKTYLIGDQNLSLWYSKYFALETKISLLVRWQKYFSSSTLRRTISCICVALWYVGFWSV